MRKDVKTGILTGACLCLIAAVWFCVKMAITKPSLNTGVQETSVSQSVIEEPPEASMMPTEPVIVQSVSQAEEKLIQNLTVHIVKSGQTLSDISKIYYNTTSDWRKIYEANKEKFPRGPDSIKPGTKLVIPK